MVVTVPADVLAPDSARPSAGTVIATNSFFLVSSVINRTSFCWWGTHWEWLTRYLNHIILMVIRLRPKWPTFRRWHFQMLFRQWKGLYIPLKNSLKFDPNGLINNESPVVWVMAWRRKDDKPLHKPIVGEFNGEYKYKTPRLNELWRDTP